MQVGQDSVGQVRRPHVGASVRDRREEVRTAAPCAGQSSCSLSGQGMEVGEDGGGEGGWDARNCECGGRDTVGSVGAVGGGVPI